MARQEGLRVEELIEDEREFGGVVAHRDEVPANAPDLREASVEAGDGPVVVEDEDPVGRRVEGGGEKGEGVTQLVLCGDLRRSVVGRNDEALHEGVFDEVDDAELERNRGFPVVAEQPDPDRHRVGGRRSTGSVAQGGHDLPAVRLGHDVGERTHLNELGIVTQKSGDRPRGGFEESGGGHQHDHRADVVHQGPETCLAAAGEFETPALGHVAQAEENQVLAGQLEWCADDLDEAPPRDGIDADLNGVADVLVLNGGQGAEHQFLVIGVHQGQARDADPIGQRSSEHALRRRVAPGDVAVLVDDDDAVGQLQHGAGKGGHVLHRWCRLRGGSAGGGRPDACSSAAEAPRAGACRCPRLFSRQVTSLLSDISAPPLVAIWLHSQEDSGLHGPRHWGCSNAFDGGRARFSRWGRGRASRMPSMRGRIGRSALRPASPAPWAIAPDARPGTTHSRSRSARRQRGATEVRPRIRFRRCHPGDGHVNDLVPKAASRR